MKQIKNFLNKINLSPKEIKVYLTGLQKGPLQASEIAKTCKLSRPSTYDTLNNLKTRRLARGQGSGYGKKFIMASANELQLLLLNKKKQQEKIENEFLDLIPHFKKISQQLEYDTKIFNNLKDSLKYLKQLEDKKTEIHKISIQIYP